MSSFSEIYQLVQRIPAGMVATYGQIAMMLGRPRAARMVGWAMHQAPAGLPCHRVVKRDGQLAPAYVFPEQRWRLAAEGVTFTTDGRVDMDRHSWLGLFEPEVPEADETIE
jgi:methylated-DNA-protein-cysteine methyltransferase-like protein